jgi:cyclopropane-fatty-acyl-phospholipid synthase
VATTTETGNAAGASKEAIQAHYDTGNEFYRLWLDSTATYSCALWDGIADEDLTRAQFQKLDHHAREAGVERGKRVLDVGCGWGSMLERLVTHHEVGHAVGLTLSKAQYEHVASLDLPRVDVLLESWAEHEAAEPYDAIISIGAVEHFVRPETPIDDRIATYRSFFRTCRKLLRPGGRFSLQTMAYGIGRFKAGALSTIFPESDLPRLAELVEAMEGSFEIVRARNDPADYARTVRIWRESMRQHRERLAEIVGDARLIHYEKFLEAGARGYDAGIFNLYRLTLKRVDIGD